MTASIVHAKRYFVDTLCVRTTQPLPPLTFKRLRRAGNFGVFSDKVPNPFDPKYAYKTQLTAPTLKQLTILKSALAKQPDKPKINRLDIKLELLTDDPEQLGKFIEQYIVKPNHRNCYVNKYKNTRYTGHENSPSQIVTYSDKGSKLDGQASSQIENRLVGVKSVKRIGIEDIDDVINLDCEAFWKDRLRLREINWRLLGKAYLRKQGRKGNPVKEGKRLRAMLREQGRETTQEVIDWCVRRGIRIERALMVVSLEKCGVGLGIPQGE